MSAAFTPGPWKIFRASNGGMLGIGVDRPNDEDHAAGVTDAYGGLWGSGGEKEANARLIAKAPEILALLIRYRNETPLGNQPHMIAYETDKIIAQVLGQSL